MQDTGQPGKNQDAVDDLLRQHASDIHALMQRRQNYADRSGENEDASGDKDLISSRRSFQAHPQKAVKVVLEWRNLTYTVKTGRGKKAVTKLILDNVSGLALPGHLLAIMGPTGSGKTSLVNALAGRLEGGKLAGTILLNGQDRRKNFRNISGYVLQDDVLLGILTVRETFTVAANLRLPRSVSSAEKSQIVEAIITELGLAKAANTRIGNAFTRGVSGGERKRVNIGVTLLGNPSILFLDEPTSGLDSFQAQRVMESMFRLAHSGRTVLSTIHQPRSSIYSMFDLLLLISEGRVLYYGPARAAVKHFERCQMSCPVHYNPADYFLDVASVDNKSSDTEAKCQDRIKLLSHVYEADRELYQPTRTMPDEDMKGLPGKFSFATSWPEQYAILQKRALIQAKRETLPIIINFVQLIVIGLLLGILYINTNYSNKSIADRTGLLFFVCIGTAFGNLLGVVNVFPQEKAMVLRERASKSYRVSAYFIAKIIADQPVRILSLLIYGVLIYWMAGLNDSAAAFFKFFVIILLLAVASGAMGLAISASCKDANMANAIAPAALIILILFGGFYANSDTIPKAIRWIQYLSHLYWAFMAMTVNEFRGQCCWECSAGAADTCVITGDQIANDQLSFGDRKYWEGVVALIGLSAFWNLLAYVILRRAIPKFLPLTSAAAAVPEASPDVKSDETKDNYAPV